MTFRRIAVAFSTLAIVASGCTGDAASPALSAQPAVRTVACPAEIAAVVLTEMTCGYLTVPEDRSDTNSATVDVFFLRVKPAGEIEGLPYFSYGYELAQIPSYASVSPPSGDPSGNGPELVLMDQRGAGHSTPSLACPEVDAASPDLLAGASASRAAFLDAIGSCHDRLTAGGVDLSAYTIAAAADDAEDLRQLFGIRSWNLISWGTTSRLLLEMERRHPEGIHALVMDSPQFPQVDDSSTASSSIRASLANLARACREDRACDRAYPDVVGTFDQVLARLDASPETATVTVGTEELTVVVDAAAMVRAMRHLLSFTDAGALPIIPALVYAARRGDVDAVADTLARDPGMCVGYLPRCIYDTSLGTFLSFTCTGEAPFVDASALADSAAAPGYAEAYGDDPYLAACDVWDVTPAEASASEAVRSDVPTLIMWGEYDAFTPFDPVEHATQTLTNALVIAVPFLGHDVFGTYDCTREIRNQWLVDLGPAPDATCLSTIPRPDFEIEH